jgi:hypothetical protein
LTFAYGLNYQNGNFVALQSRFLNRARSTARAIAMKALVLVVSFSWFWAAQCGYLYYRVGQGPIFGPFEEDLIRRWNAEGHFDGADLQVAKAGSDNFVPYRTEKASSAIVRRKGTVKGKLSAVAARVNDLFGLKSKRRESHCYVTPSNSQSGATNVNIFVQRTDTHMETHNDETPAMQQRVSDFSTETEQQVMSEQLPSSIDETVPMQYDVHNSVNREPLDDFAPAPPVQYKPENAHFLHTTEETIHQPQQARRGPVVEAEGEHKVYHKTSQDRGEALVQSEMLTTRSTRKAKNGSLLRPLSLLLPPVMRETGTHIVHVTNQRGGTATLLLLLLSGVLRAVRMMLNISLALTIAQMITSMPHPHASATGIINLSSQAIPLGTGIYTAVRETAALSAQWRSLSLTELQRYFGEVFTYLILQLQALRWRDIPSLRQMALTAQAAAVHIYYSAMQHRETLRAQMLAMGPQVVQVGLILSFLAVLTVAVLPQIEAVIEKSASDTESGHANSAIQAAAVQHIGDCTRLLATWGAAAVLAYFVTGAAHGGQVALPFVLSVLIGAVELYIGAGAAKRGDQPHHEHDADVNLRRIHRR